MGKVIRSTAAGWIALVWLLAGSLVVSAESVTIKFMLRGGSPEWEAFATETIAAFEALHPEIDVEWEIAGDGWRDQVVEGQRLMMRTAGLMPIRISLLPEYLDKLGDKNAHHLAEAVQEAITDPTAVLVESQRTGALINTAIRRSIITNQVPVRAAIQEIAPVIRSIMEEARARQ